MFDLLTYEKGCAVLRMLEQHIGPEVFRDGVRTYLKAHAYANTVTTDLWDALEEASGEPVRDVMNTFILQGGHPLVSLRGDTLRPAAVLLRPGARRHRVGHRRRLERPGGRAGPARSTGSPAHRRASWCSSTTPVELAEAGRGPGRGQRRRLGRLPGGLRRRAPPGPGRPPVRADPARAGQPAGRHLGHHAGRAFDAEGVLDPGGQARPRARPDAVGPGRRRPPPVQPHRRPRATSAALRQAVAALVGPQYRHLGFEAQPGEGERTPTLRSLAISLLGTVGADAERAGRGGPTLRRLADRRRARRADPGRRGGGHAGRGGPARAARATTTRCWSATGPPPRRRRRCARSTRSPPSPTSSWPQRTFDLAMTEVRSQNGWIVIAALAGQPGGRPGHLAPHHRVVGRHARALPQERPCPHRRGHPRAVRRRRVRPRRSCSSWTTTRWPRAPAGWPSRWSAWASTSPSPPASAARLGDSLPGRHRRGDGLTADGRRRGRRPDDRRASRPTAALESARVQAVVRAARRTRGFMPDDEGEALLHAALRAGRAPPDGAAPTTFVEIGAWCGKSSLYLGAAAEATGAVAVLHRPPPGLRGEPARLGAPRGRPGRPRRGPDRHPAALAAGRRRRPASKAVGRRGGGRLADRGRPLAPAAGLLLHRRWARRRAGLGRLPGLGAPGGPRRLAGHPRRLPRPGRRGPAALRALLRRARLGRVHRGRRVRQPARAAPGRRARAPERTDVSAGGAAHGRRPGAVRLGQVQRGRQALAPEQPGGRRGVRQRVGGQHHGARRCRWCARCSGKVTSRDRPCPSSRSRRRGAGSGRRRRARVAGPVHAQARRGPARTRPSRPP